MRPPRAELPPEQRQFRDAIPALATIYGPSKIRVDTVATIDADHLVGRWRIPAAVCQPRTPLYDEIAKINDQLVVARKKVVRPDVEHHFGDELGFALRGVDQMGQVVDMIGFAAQEQGIAGSAILVQIHEADFMGNPNFVLKLGRAFETRTSILKWYKETNRITTHSTLTALGQEKPSTTLALDIQIIPTPEGSFLRNEEIPEALVQVGLVPMFEASSENFPIFEQIGPTALPQAPLRPDDEIEMFIEIGQRQDERGNDRLRLKSYAEKGNQRIADSEFMQGSFQPIRRAQRMLRPLE